MTNSALREIRLVAPSLRKRYAVKTLLARLCSKLLPTFSPAQLIPTRDEGKVAEEFKTMRVII